jgi:hypothetical protein
MERSADTRRCVVLRSRRCVRGRPARAQCSPHRRPSARSRMPRSIFSVMTKLTNGLDDEPGASVARPSEARKRSPWPLPWCDRAKRGSGPLGRCRDGCVGGHFPESGSDTFLRAVGRAVRVAVSARRARSGRTDHRWRCQRGDGRLAALIRPSLYRPLWLDSSVTVVWSAG